MKVRRRERQFCDIDVGAFADIAFLLIIFFILTTTFIKPFGREMQLPSGRAADDTPAAPPLTLTLRGQIVLWGSDAETVDIPTLRKRLVAYQFPTKTEHQRMVIVDAADDVPFDSYFQVVTAISHAGGILALVDDTSDEGGGS